MSTYTKNLNLFKYDVTADEKVPFSITEALNNNWDIIDEKCNGGGLEICDIGMTLYVDETKGLRRYLNGQIVGINTNTQAFLNRLKDITTLHPSLLCTEDEWQTAKTMSAFGQVGKFVFNYSGDEIVSVRIPAIVNVQGLFDLQNLGMTVSAGLPNITGKVVSDYSSNWEGAFYDGGTINGGGGSGKDSLAIFDASRSSSIYGKSNTVQQETIQYPYFIQIATGSETENNIINEIELNNPFSLLDYKYSEYELNNLSWLRSEGQHNSKATYPAVYNLLLKIYNGTETKAGVSVKLSTETYTDYDFVLNTAEETFRLPLKTNLASGKAVVGNGMTLGLNNGSSNFGFAINDSGQYNYYLYNTGVYGKEVGTQASTISGNSYVKTPDLSSIGITTDSTKSGIETSDNGLYLYFYVGETVQNANLIDAGRIVETMATKSMVDGQWVVKPEILSTDTAIGTYEIDLSSYLPNDNYDYEVLIQLEFRNDSTKGSEMTINGIYQVAGHDGVGRIQYLTILIPILSSDRKITKVITNVKLTNATIKATQFRRLGTNQ